MLKINNLQKIIKAGVYLALITPLVFIPQTIFGTIFGKALYFQIVIELALPFFLYLVFVYKEARPKINLLTKLILIFFTSLFISSLLGLDFFKSFWGYDERIRGLFIMLHLLAFYFYIITVFKTEKEKKSLLFFAVLVGLMVSLFGLAERMNVNLRIDKSIKVNIKGHRISSTTGNPIFLAGYLIFVFFISWTYIAWYKDKTRFIALFIVATSFLAALATGTRGAVLGILAGLFVILFFFFLSSSKKRKIIIATLTFILLFIVFFSIFFNPGVLKKSKYDVLTRLTNLSLKEASGQQRFLLWGVAWKAFLDRPIFGWGLENFDYAYDSHYDVRFLRYNINQTWADRAHNIFLDFLVMGGIVGLVFYLVIFVYIFYILIRRFLLKKNLALIGLFAAFLFYNIFELDSPSVNLMLFFTFSIIYLLQEDEYTLYTNNKKDKKGLLMILFLLSIFSIYNFNIKPIGTGVNFINFLHTSNVVEKKKLVEKFLDPSSPYKHSLRQRFANEVFLEVGDTNFDKSYIDWALDRAIEEMKLSYKEVPQEFSYPFTLGNLYLRKQEYDTAIDYFKKALILSPKRQAVLFQLSTVFLLKGNNEEAINLLQEVVNYDNNSGQAYWRLAMGYLANKDKDNAQLYINKAIDLGFVGFIQEEVSKALNLCIEKEDYMCVILAYDNLAERPDKSSYEKADYYAKIATAYLALSDKEKAIEYALKASKTDSSFKEEADLFLQEIDRLIE